MGIHVCRAVSREMFTCHCPVSPSVVAIQVPATPPAFRPSAVVTPYRPTSRGSSPNERTPMTGFRGSELTSSTGARFQLKPTARISSAVAFATSKTRLGDRAAAIAMAPGNCVARSPSPYRETSDQPCNRDNKVPFHVPGRGLSITVYRGLLSGQSVVARELV